MVMLSAMVAYVLQRRGRLAGRQLPGPRRADRAPRRRAHDLGAAEGWAVQTMPGLILVEIAFGLPFSILLFRAFCRLGPA